jgi:3-hydroxyacyl-CoA dehydrogenase/enoyl-CoA hydratase/3-hydroxybutyryl-CoA epimerase/3-hydroxyacyl-CoA dehydrogenase/enoyl-CoA hydratase/3-hydroxybutyryl-CoA epimerase/enoyl-CoA isomerase
MTALLTLTHLRLEQVAPDVVAMVLDDPAKSANVLTSGLHRDLETGLDFLDGLPNLKGVILTSAKPRIFVAGADLVNITRTLDWPDSRIAEFCFHGQRLYNRFRERSYVSVAAIRGACVGGGWELALGCDYQIAVNDPKTFFGLPEVRLGLVPGWAGTVRLPRLIGIESALDLITSGRNLSVAEAQQLGLLAAVVSSEELLPAAVRQIEAALETQQYLEKRTRDLESVELSSAERQQLESVFLGRIAANSAIHPFAPTVVAQHLLASCSRPFGDACESEADAMTKVYGSPASYGLLNNYFLGEHNRRRPGWVEPSTAAEAPQRLGVVGLGVMGRSILQAAARKSTVAFGFDPVPAAAAAMHEQATNGKLAIQVAEKLSELSSSQLVIEAVVERAETKREVLAELCRLLPADALLATNTSTISLRELLPSVTAPERFCGIHFCHPTLMQLVEVIRGDQTSEATVNAAVQWVRGLGKTPVVVKDAPGFVVNRVLSAFLDAALQLAVEGHSIAEIDLAVRNFGFQAGPFEMMDLIGLETTILAGQSLIAAGIPQVSRLPALVKLVRQGRLGRKNGQGFYRYFTPEGPAEADPAGERVLDAYRESENSPGPAEEIAPRIMAAALLAALDVWERGTICDPRDLDLCVIQGLSFPVHEGGLLFWASRQGPEALAAALQWATGLHPEAAVPAKLIAWQASGQPFYASV